MEPHKLALYFVESTDPGPRIFSTEGYPEGHVWTVGRGKCDISFRFPTVSARHARIRFEEQAEQWQVIDCDSRNGTYSNGKKLSSENWTKIKENDVIVFGHAQARVVCSFDADDTLEIPFDDEPTGDLRGIAQVDATLTATEQLPKPVETPPSSNPWQVAGMVLSWAGRVIEKLPPWMQFTILVLLSVLTAIAVVLIYT